MKKDVIIIGAGASGLVCAIEAGKRGRSVLVIDHTQKIGSKIRVSGGGRCNFTNRHVSPEHYISQNRHFCKSALSRYMPEEFISLLRKHRVSYHEKEAGQLFCDTTSAEIIIMLRAECEKAAAEFRLGCSIREITHNHLFTVETDKGSFQAESLVIATGGLSYPKLGASDFGIRVAEQFKINVISPRPGLVPLTFSHKELEIFRELSGVSIDAEVSINKVSFRGSLLFTHRGLSGPAILQISSYWNKGELLSIDLLPGTDAHDMLLAHSQSRKDIKTVLSQYLPSRFIQAWCSNYLRTKPVCQFTEKELGETAEKLHAWQIKPSGTEGYAAAEVTVGGIDTNEVSSKTMETKKVPGLYIVGEVLDVTGQLGGYNLHWAWASGHAAGQYV
ncbi:MAG: NAD(P)/FAD-dependent oxidoreductase [Nitrospirae bacterium]|nr:NAD(P)/FAD-dependent oxidoreductase [Nitrospirota bacterium]